MKPLHKIVRKKRKEYGYGVRELSRLTGIPHGNLLRIESGDMRRVSFAEGMKLCKAFNVNPWKVKL